MDSREKRARDIQKQIGKILFEDWDPIGVRGANDEEDEYDSYIGKVYRLLTTKPSEKDVEAFLRSIEREWMGLPSLGNSASVAAKKLCKLDVRL